MKNLKKYFKGFTLVELIIVITILAILATIAFVSFQNYTRDARDANRTATIKNIEKGLELFTLKTGNFPTPDEPTTFTGWLDWKVKINQWIVWDGVATIINMNTTPLDPNDKSKYTYSTFWDDNKYYQVAINAENREISFIPQALAFAPKSAIVQWNYRFDPSLPSLIIVPGSVNTASWIFDPKVCFVIDGWQNSLSSSSGSCIEKEEMSLKEFDNSLVGYWDMESITNDWKLKDLSGNSGNGNFVALGINNAVITKEKEIYNSWILQNILAKEPQKINGILGWAFAFDGGWYFTINDDKKIFKNIDYLNSITISAIIKDTWVVDDTLWCEQWPWYQTYAFSAYRYNLSNSNGSIYALPNSKGTFIAWRKSDYFANEYHLYTFTKNENLTSFYIDGKKVDSRKINLHVSWLTTYPFVWPFIWASKHCWAGANINRFIGEIDEVKIYNRTLSDEEILGQAKITGF